MRWTALAMVAFLAACDGGSDGGDTDSGTGTGAAASSSGDAQTTGPDGSSAGGSNTTATTMPPGTNPATSSGGDDASSSSGDDTSAGVATEGTEGSSSDSSGDEGGGSIDVTLTGCDIDFGGTVVVSYNGSLGVASVYDSGATLTGSFQFDLEGPATFQLSTQHRVDTMTIVNMVDTAQGTWTNLDSDALSPGGVDSIGGTLDVQVWEPSEGRAEIVFEGVSLMNVSTGDVCTIDGTVTAEELYP
ncbi:MAG: hypothetical protein ACE37F_03935 [Nannocystaceae bacterium]|nr:hypothetical protein [bacterium]